MQVVDAIGTRGMAAGETTRRARAHAKAHSHSAQVRTLRRIIPLAAGASALALAAITLFNPFATIAPGITIGPVSLSGAKIKMESPRLSGFRKGDRGYEVTATAAFQDVRKPTVIELQAMKGHVGADDKGGLAHLEAATGLFDTARESLTLNQDIRLWTDKGEEARLASASVDFKAGTIKSSEPVTVTVPSGSVVADSLDVVDNGRVISFIGNVRAEFHREAPEVRATAPKLADAGGRP